MMPYIASPYSNAPQAYLVWENVHVPLNLISFYHTHLYIELSTYLWMLNLMKGNGTAIEGCSQLLLARVRCALNHNHQRTLAIRLHTHSPQRLAGILDFFIYFLSTWARGTAQEFYPKTFIDSEHSLLEPPASLNIECTWTNTGWHCSFSLCEIQLDVIEKFSSTILSCRKES